MIVPRTNDELRDSRSTPRRLLDLELRTLQVGRGRHAAGRAHADDRAATLAPAELEQRRPEISNARHAIRVAERYRAAVHVGDLPGCLELRLVVERGDRVCFVELPQIHV